MSQTASPLLRTDLDGVFRPSSVAIYGISERTSLRIADNMTIPGVPFYGINPTKTEACGVTCYPTVGDCPTVPDMVVMGVGHGRIEAAVDDVLSVEGVRAVITPGLGNEAGAEGAAIAQRISDRLRAAGIAMVGPNCMGVATPGSPSPWIGSLHSTFVGGPVATLAHSGSIGEILVSLGPRIGFRTVISAGNETVVDAADFVSWCADDPGTRVVGLFLAAVRRPAAFEAALRRLAEAGKVAIVLKVGTSTMGAAAALAHAGALVGSDRGLSAMLRHYNAIRVDDFGDLLEHLEVFSRERPPRGRRIGAVTNSGGEGEYFADKAEQAGIPLQLFSDGLRSRIAAEFPNFTHVGNPADCWAIDDDRIVFPRVFQLMAELRSAEIARGYGIDYVRSVRCGDADAAVSAAADLGYPVVCKVDGVAHKARVGGVALHLADADAVRSAAERMGGRVLVAEHVTGGVELLVGAVRDADYGPTVVVGAGGALAEQLDLVAVSLAPVDAEGARRLIASLPALGRMLRGAPPAGLVDAVVAVSRLIGGHPELAGVDVNPPPAQPQSAGDRDCPFVLQ